MTISPALTVAAVQPFHTPAPQPHALREPPQPSPAKEANRPVATEVVPTQPVAMPPVVTALTADFEAGRAAAEDARAAYLAERRQSQS